jgi:hypothetical protein
MSTLGDGAELFAAMQSDREAKAQQAMVDLSRELKGIKLKTRLERIEGKIDRLQESVTQLLAGKGSRK